jgi:biopolymer transport protein ExbD
MRYAAPRASTEGKVDMTPMIDMVFQLVAFFMVIVNFSEADQDQRIKLPLSELAKPLEAAAEGRITLQLTDEGTVILGATEVTLPQLDRKLLREKQLIEATGKKSAQDATVVIRADRAAPTGEVQEVIQVCQKRGFVKFALRARQQFAQSVAPGST